jgi:hypothetical protein
VSCHQNEGQNYDVRIANKGFVNVADLKCLVTAPRNQNRIHEEIKSRLNSRTVFCDSVQNLSSSQVLPKNVSILIYTEV